MRIVIAASVAACVVLVLSCASIAQDSPALDRVLYNGTYGSIRKKAVIVDPGKMSLSRAREIGKTFLHEAAGSRFAEVVIGVSEEEIRVSTMGTVPKIESEASFDQTIQQLSGQTGARGWAVHPVARVILIDGNALLSYREAGRGNPARAGVSEEILAGTRDPTKLDLTGQESRLLTIGIKSGSSRQHPLVAAFFKNLHIGSCAMCREAAEYARFVSDAETAEVQIRPDVWFANIAFPVLFRFEPDNVAGTYADLADRVSAPSIERFYRSPQVNCRLQPGNFVCYRYGVIERVP